MKRYEELRVYTDPFDIMCGECQEHEVEVWSEVSLDELKEHHLGLLYADKWMCDYVPNWEPTPENFEEFLESCIKLGTIREVA